MATFFNTSAPANLLRALRKAIDDGHIVTWSYDKDGDFTHNTDQWRHQAWMRPQTLKEQLAFYILPPNSKVISKVVYGVYHGRLIESMTTHFDAMFSQAWATSQATGADKIRGSAA